jgi:uncharacterized protein (DUF3084 family)
MRTLILMLGGLLLSMCCTTTVKAEDAADTAAQIKALQTEVEALKAKLKYAEGSKGTVEIRRDIYKRGYEKLLEEVTAQQSLLEMKKAATKISDAVDTDNQRLDDLLAGKKPSK